VGTARPDRSVRAVGSETASESGEDGFVTSPSPVEDLAAWSPWVALAEAVALAPLVPGVYLAREGESGPTVYVGMAGERRGRGIRGRLTVYSRGRGAVSGLGEAAMDRALADPEWVAERLVAIEEGRPERSKVWAQRALVRADLHLRWSTTADRDSAVALERAALDVLRDDVLWNRLR
jgi:hypothetical protein